MARFAKRYPEARVFDLTRNYRSSPQILAWANLVAREPGSKPLVATRPSGQTPKVHRLDDEVGEAAWVSAAIRKAIDAGTAPSQIAILSSQDGPDGTLGRASARKHARSTGLDDAPRPGVPGRGAKRPKRPDRRD